MNSKRFDLNDYLEHILESAKEAIHFTDGMTVDDFLSDRRTQQAVVMSLVIIGEAATKIINSYPEHISNYPDIPFHKMRGMRNRIAHGYFEIDLEVVWNTVTDWLPTLIASIDRLD